MADDQFYAEMAAMAAEMIEEYGRAAQLRVAGAVSGPAWEQVGETSLIGVLITEMKLSVSQRDGQRILAGDKLLMMAATVEDVPANAELIDGPTVYKVVSADRLKPGNVVCYFELHARR